MERGATGWTGATGASGPQGATGPTGPDPAAQAFIGHFGSHTGEAASGTGVDDCVLGQILLTAGNTIIGGVAANGQILPINQNTALFSLIGTTYGGDQHLDIRVAGPSPRDAEQHDLLDLH